MWFEKTLRRISVGKRLAIASAALVLPMTILIAASAMVLQQQESELHKTIEASVDTLLPLTTLEYDLQRALTDELEAETGQSVPDYGGLTGSIDRLFFKLRSQTADPAMPSGAIRSAQQAWNTARPGIERLVEHVTPLRIVGAGAAAATARAELIECSTRLTPPERTWQKRSRPAPSQSPPLNTNNCGGWYGHG